MSLPRVHPRERVVTEASLKLFGALEGLTDGERVMVLSEALARTAKYLIRYERHGDYDTPGGVTRRTP